MNYFYIIIIAGIISAIAQYIDKHLVNKGITRKDYFYYMCLTMVPFSLISIGIEIIIGEFKFVMSIISIFLIILAMIVRYYKQHTVVGCLKYLNPYEDASYLTLGIVVAYIIDILLGIENISITKIFSIFLIIAGVFILSDVKLKISNLKKDLAVRIILSLIMGYITHFALKYMSNGLFLLTINLILVIIFAKDYNFKYHISKKNIIKWVFIQQFFGFMYLYLYNYLSAISVTLSSYVKPVAIISVVIISLFFKDRNKKPSSSQIFGIVLILGGVYLNS